MVAAFPGLGGTPLFWASVPRRSASRSSSGGWCFPGLPPLPPLGPTGLWYGFWERLGNGSERLWNGSFLARRSAPAGWCVWLFTFDVCPLCHTPRLGRNGGNAFRLSFGKQEGKRGRRDCRLVPLACLPWLRWPCSGKVGPQGVPPFRPRLGGSLFPPLPTAPPPPALPPKPHPPLSCRHLAPFCPRLPSFADKRPWSCRPSPPPPLKAIRHRRPGQRAARPQRQHRAVAPLPQGLLFPLPCCPGRRCFRPITHWPTGCRSAVALFAFCPATPWVLLGDSLLGGFGNSSPRGQACLLGRCAPGSRYLVAHWPAAAPCQQESSSSCLQPSPIALKHEREYKPRWLVASEQMARCSQERPPGKLPRCRSRREYPHDQQRYRTSVMLVHWTIVASTALRPYRRTEPKSRRRCNGASTGTGNSFK